MVDYDFLISINIINIIGGLFLIIITKDDCFNNFNINLPYMLIFILGISMILGTIIGSINIIVENINNNGPKKHKYKKRRGKRRYGR